MREKHSSCHSSKKEASEDGLARSREAGAGSVAEPGRGCVAEPSSVWKSARLQAGDLGSVAEPGRPRLQGSEVLRGSRGDRADRSECSLPAKLERGRL